MLRQGRDWMRCLYLRMVFLLTVTLLCLFDACLVCVQLLCRISPLFVNVGSPTVLGRV